MTIYKDWSLVTSHDNTLVLFQGIIKQDYKNKYLVTGDWSQSTPYPIWPKIWMHNTIWLSLHVSDQMTLSMESYQALHCFLRPEYLNA